MSTEALREKIWTWQFSSFVVVACLGLGLAALWIMRSSSPLTTPTSDPMPSLPTGSVAQTRGLTLAERMQNKLDEFDYPSAFRMASFVMSDPNGEAAGVEMFALWASRHLRWSDVSVSEDETTFSSVQEDPAQERGKRVCPSGRVLQIAPLKAGETYGRPVARGLLQSDVGDLYQLLAAGDWATIVKQSHARFCGVVTGRSVSLSVDDPNVHGVALIGMFDVPRNRSGPSDE